MQNARLDEARAGIKTAGRKINNLRYTDDTTLMADSEELKSLLMKVKKESEKVGLKLNSGHTGKGQFSLQSQRKAMLKNAQTTTQLHSSHMLVK